MNCWVIEMHIFNLSKWCQKVFQSGCIKLHAPSNVWEFQLLHIFVSLGIITLFNSSHSRKCIATSHCSFNLYFHDQWYWAPFHFVEHLGNFSCKLSLQVSCQLFYGVIYLFLIGLWEFLNKLFIRWIANIFSHSIACSFHFLRGIFWWVEFFCFYNPI